MLWNGENGLEEISVPRCWWCCNFSEFLMSFQHVTVLSTKKKKIPKVPNVYLSRVCAKDFWLYDAQRDATGDYLLIKYIRCSSSVKTGSTWVEAIGSTKSLLKEYWGGQQCCGNILEIGVGPSTNANVVVEIVIVLGWLSVVSQAIFYTLQK